jgi:Type VI secretion system (T6SS), amidase immunity protein
MDRTAVRKYSQADLLRNYAIARCFSEAFPGSPVATDASASAAGYLERGSVSADAYAEIAKLSQKFLARKYPSLSGEPLQTMKCIDLFYSSDLDRVVRRYAPKR